MKKTLVLLFLMAAPLFASQDPLLAKYEAARQALLKNSVAEVQIAAQNLAAAARTARQVPLATRADTLGHAATIRDARNAFSAVSDELIRYRDAQGGDRPAVAYCPMEKRSWLQPKGAITNPYVDASMRACGEIKR